MPKFSVNSHWSEEKPLAYGQKEVFIQVRTEDDTPTLMGVSLASVRRALVIGDPNEEVEAEAYIEWGNGQGNSQKAVVDVGRGSPFTVPCADLRVWIKNIGNSEQQENWPTRIFKADATPIAARTEPAYRALRIATSVAATQLAPAAESAAQFVPDFARTFTFPRYPALAVAVRFFGVGATGGAPTPMVQYVLAADEFKELKVPPGADRVSVLNADGNPLLRGKLVFELSFG